MLREFKDVTLTRKNSNQVWVVTGTFNTDSYELRLEYIHGDVSTDSDQRALEEEVKKWLKSKKWLD